MLDATYQAKYDNSNTYPQNWISQTIYVRLIE